MTFRGVVLVTILSAGSLVAASDRIQGPVDPGRTVALKGQVHPRAQLQYDRGALDPTTQLEQVTLMLQPDASLEPFLAEQQNPSSPNYHRWLTPGEFGDRFGLSRGDIAKVTGWLESQGLKVDRIAEGRHWITFGATAGAIGRALGTQIRRYRVDGQDHFANAGEPRVPAALEPVIAGFQGLDDFGARAFYVKSKLQPDFNYGGTANFLAPDDLAAIYNMSPLFQAGIDGTGQSIVIVGDSALDLTDIRSFRQLFNLPANDPQKILVGADPGTNNDMVEADLDLEIAGAVARNANLIYVYARNVFTAAQYAVDQNLAPVMSMSFGACEALRSVSTRAIAQQANAQGITWLAASGDVGAAQCDIGSPTQQASKGPTVSVPASYPEVTAVGGTTLSEGTGTYWSPSNGISGGSALSYIPEVAWNDAAEDGALVAAGGGASAAFAKPGWQTGPGVPADNARDVPDISFAASPNHDGYLIVTFGEFSAVGGTSAATPLFAGMLGLLNQYLGTKGASKAGLGNVNPVLYRMAQNSKDVFHDITTGDINVPCALGTPGCVNGQLGYSAGPGYDLATGLGSADAYRLVSEWSAGQASTTSLAASAATVSVSDSVNLTATVSGTGTTAPTGSIAFLVNDVNIGSAALTASGGNASASFNTTALAVAGGNGTINALYSGDTVFAGSSGSTKVTVQYPTGGSYIVVTVNPSPTPQAGPQWPLTITLAERAGVATTLTAFSADGVNLPLGSFFASPKIPANGSITSSLAASGYVPPADVVFKFTGADADGKTWSQSVTVHLTSPAGGAPALAPQLVLTGTPSTVQQNPQADPTCQWVQQLTLQETGGFLMQLTKLTMDATDVSTQIQQVFGTTRIAPYGVLQGTICFRGPAAPTFKNYQLTGTSPELGVSVLATLPVTFGPPAASASTFSVSTQAIQLSASSASNSPSASLGVSFGSASTAWNVAITPANLTTKWLTVSPLSGTGSAQLTVKASGAGLSPGVYTAILNLQAVNAIPQAIDVPVTFVVGAAGDIKITGIANSGSYQSAVAAPGMLMTVFGTGLAPVPAQADTAALPILPLSLKGVSATVNGVTAPIVSIAPTQMTVQVPYETGLGPAVLGVNNNGHVTAFYFPVSLAAPGFVGFVLDPFSGASIPSAAVGAAVALEMTGDGEVTPLLATGATPPSSTATSRLPKPRLPVTVTVGGVPASITFLGIPPGSIGVTEIDITIPAKAPKGLQPVVVTVGGVSSPPLNLIITP